MKAVVSEKKLWQPPPTKKQNKKQTLIESASMFSYISIRLRLCQKGAILNDYYLFKRIACEKTILVKTWNDKVFVWP